MGVSSSVNTSNNTFINSGTISGSSISPVYGFNPTSKNENTTTVTSETSPEGLNPYPTIVRSGIHCITTDKNAYRAADVSADFLQRVVDSGNKLYILPIYPYFFPDSEETKDLRIFNAQTGAIKDGVYHSGVMIDPNYQTFGHVQMFKTHDEEDDDWNLKLADELSVVRYYDIKENNPTEEQMLEEGYYTVFIVDYDTIWRLEELHNLNMMPDDFYVNTDLCELKEALLFPTRHNLNVAFDRGCVEYEVTVTIPRDYIIGKRDRDTHVDVGIVKISLNDPPSLILHVDEEHYMEHEGLFGDGLDPDYMTMKHFKHTKVHTDYIPKKKRWVNLSPTTMFKKLSRLHLFKKTPPAPAGGFDQPDGIKDMLKSAGRTLLKGGKILYANRAKAKTAFNVTKNLLAAAPEVAATLGFEAPPLLTKVSTLAKAFSSSDAEDMALNEDNQSTLVQMNQAGVRVHNDNVMTSTAALATSTYIHGNLGEESDVAEKMNDWSINGAMTVPKSDVYQMMARPQKVANAMGVTLHEDGMVRDAHALERRVKSAQTQFGPISAVREASKRVDTIEKKVAHPGIFNMPASVGIQMIAMPDETIDISGSALPRYADILPTGASQVNVAKEGWFPYVYHIHRGVTHDLRPHLTLEVMGTITNDTEIPHFIAIDAYIVKKDPVTGAVNVYASTHNIDLRTAPAVAFAERIKLDVNSGALTDAYTTWLEGKFGEWPGVKGVVGRLLVDGAIIVPYFKTKKTHNEKVTITKCEVTLHVPSAMRPQALSFGGIQLSSSHVPFTYFGNSELTSVTLPWDVEFQWNLYVSAYAPYFDKMAREMVNYNVKGVNSYTSLLWSIWSVIKLGFDSIDNRMDMEDYARALLKSMPQWPYRNGPLYASNTVHSLLARLALDVVPNLAKAPSVNAIEDINPMAVGPSSQQQGIALRKAWADTASARIGKAEYVIE